jgi:diguanylate cyclase (GGDEF)-like protein/PAS domain S-box-containing protein
MRKAGFQAPCLELLDQLFDGIYLVDLQRRIVFWNACAERITGYGRDEVLGRSCTDNILRHVSLDGEPLCEHGCPLQATMRDGQPRTVDVYLHHKAGHRVPVRVRSLPLRDEAGEIAGSIEIFEDKSSQESIFRQLKEMERSIYQDELTGIGNRKFAEVRMSELMGAFREHGQSFGVRFIDIDHFKRVNDIHGHQVGDRVIRLVARTLQNGLRPTDRVCRFGGEEFLCLLPNITSEEMRQVAERLRVLVEQSGLDLPMGTLQVSVSIGGALSRKGDTPFSIIDRADQAMYRAKELGRNRVVVPESREMSSPIPERSPAQDAEGGV